VELRQGLWQFVRKLNRDGHTIVLTTHYLEEAETLCGRIAMLKAGRIVALDSTANLLARFTTHSLRVRLVAPLAGSVLEVKPDDEGWMEFGFERFDEVEGVLAKLRAAGAEIAEMHLGEPDLEQVFIGVMHAA